jgi:hypothetical protein
MLPSFCDVARIRDAKNAITRQRRAAFACAAHPLLIMVLSKRSYGFVPTIPDKHRLPIPFWETPGGSCIPVREVG